MPPPDDQTAAFTQLSEGTPGVFIPRRDPVRVTFGAASNVGRVRENNEDHYAVTRRTRKREILLTNVAIDNVVFPEDHAYVLIVADGVGGRGFGELASELVLRFGWELSERATSWLMKFDPQEWDGVRERVSAYAQHIQAALVQHAHSHPKLADMGTTWTCVYLMGNHAVLAHVGDSRAYVFRSDQLHQLSHDHTFAQELIDLGMPAEETRRFKHVLTNSFGARTEQVRPQVEHAVLESGDRLLLCTDGLTDMVSDSEIVDTLQHVNEPQAACDALIQRALGNGGKDNVTVVMADVCVETPPASSPASGRGGSGTVPVP